MDSSLLDGFTFTVAEVEERDAVLDLRRRVYTEDWSYVPKDDLDLRAYHLIARDSADEIVAALRMVGPEQRPFDIEQFAAISDFLPEERVPAEVGRLCVRRDHRRVSRGSFLQMGMLKLSYAFARSRGITDLVMYTFPHLLPFYRAAFFERPGLTFEHPGYGRQMHIMRLDLVSLECRLSESRKPVARFLSATHPNIRF